MHSVLGSFFMGPISGEGKKRRMLARLNEERKHEGTKDPAKYLLSAPEMCDNDYPLPSYIGEVSQLEDGWVESPLVDTTDDGALPKVLAMDCEMVSAFVSPSFSLLNGAA
jgi:RNA exonuclease 1